MPSNKNLSWSRSDYSSMKCEVNYDNSKLVELTYAGCVAENAYAYKFSNGYQIILPILVESNEEHSFSVLCSVRKKKHYVIVPSMALKLRVFRKKTRKTSIKANERMFNWYFIPKIIYDALPNLMQKPKQSQPKSKNPAPAPKEHGGTINQLEL